MKKYLPILFLSTLLIGCSSPSTSTPAATTPVKVPNENQSQIFTPETVDTQPGTLETAPTNSTKDSTSKASNPSNEVSTPVSTANDNCGNIAANPRQLSECYWNLAMKNKDQSLCENIVYQGNPGTDRDYLSTDSCKKTLNYTTQNAQWSLLSGLPLDESAYGGRARLTGWVVYTSSYVEDSTAHFHVADSSVSDLPFLGRKYTNLNLSLNEKSLIEKLTTNYSQDHPAVIISTKIAYPIEGTPFITVSEIVQ